MVVVWTPNGDAVIAFVAGQSADRAVTRDVSSDRVFYASFKRSLATTPKASTGQRYGISSFVAIDTNAVTTDDNSARGMFVSSNLIDGETTFTGVLNSLERSGTRGDASSQLKPFIFIGWTYRLLNTNDIRVEGHFVDLGDRDQDGDRLELTAAAPTQIPLAGIGAGENVDLAVRTSGRDMLFTANDTSPNPDQQRMYLVRVDDATNPPTVKTANEISRGTNTTGASTFTNVYALLGDGLRSLNGQSSTWVVYRENAFQDATVTQADADLMIAQIDAAGAVTVDEFDHNAVGAANPNNLGANVSVQVCRGGTRAFIYYQQQFDVAGAPTQTDTALFVRALRLSGLNSLANNVSNESTLNDTHDTNSDNDTDVVQFKVAKRDPFCAADSNNDASYVAFEQEIEADADGRTLRARLVTVTNINANPLAITLGAEETIIANSDTDFGIRDLMVLPGSASTGEGLVYYSANGNNISNNAATGAFLERRPFLYATALPNSQNLKTPVQVGSDSGPGLVAQAQFQQIETDANLAAIVTPRRPASRDFAFDNDTAAPEFAVLIANEHLDAVNSENGTSYVGRRIDLRSGSFAKVGARFSPLLTASPQLVGTDDGHEFEDITALTIKLLPRGNDLVVIYNTESQDDNGGNGKFFVNTMTNGNWSDAALLTNDSVEPLNDGEIPFTKSGANYEIISGVSNGCDTAVGTWLFWLREDANAFDTSSERFTLQGRRITGTSMSKRP